MFQNIKNFKMAEVAYCLNENIMFALDEDQTFNDDKPRFGLDDDDDFNINTSIQGIQIRRLDKEYRRHSGEYSSAISGHNPESFNYFNVQYLQYIIHTSLIFVYVNYL